MPAAEADRAQEREKGNARIPGIQSRCLHTGNMGMGGMGTEGGWVSKSSCEVRAARMQFQCSGKGRFLETCERVRAAQTGEKQKTMLAHTEDMESGEDFSYMSCSISRS